MNDFRNQSPWGSPPPGGGGNGDGGFRRGPTPPNLDEILKKLQDTINKFLPGKSGGAKPIVVGLIILALLWVGSGLYRVLPDEQGVVLRFGKFVKTTQPGLNYHLPFPVESVLTPKVTKVNRMDIGFRSERESGFSSGGGVADVPEESLMLTGDENIVDINFVVQWFVSDAAKYVFNIRDPEKNIKDSAESVMREVIGKTNIDFALAEGRDQVRQEAQESLQKILDGNESGITVSSLLLQKSDPPPAVIDDFKDVQRARADQERLINEAQAYANRIVPEAKGEASKIRESAEAYKQEVIAIADGASKRFLSVYNEYKEAKDVTRRRIYLETMEKVMQNMNKVIIDNDSGSGVLPYLPLPELNKSLKKNSEAQ